MTTTWSTKPAPSSLEGPHSGPEAPESAAAVPTTPAPNPAEGPAKRKAERYLTKDDPADNDDHDDIDPDDPATDSSTLKNSHGQPLANAETLARRKMVRLPRTSAGEVDLHRITATAGPTHPSTAVAATPTSRHSSQNSNPWARVQLPATKPTLSTLSSGGDSVVVSRGPPDETSPPEELPPKQSAAAPSIFGASTGFQGFQTIRTAAAAPSSAFPAAWSSSSQLSNPLTTTTTTSSSTGWAWGQSQPSTTVAPLASSSWANPSGSGFGSGVFSSAFHSGATTTTTTTAVHWGSNHKVSEEDDAQDGQGGGDDDDDHAADPEAENPALEQSSSQGPLGAAYFPDQYEVKSGEEEETVLFEARCKTHRWGRTDPTTPASRETAAVPSVPPSEHASLFTSTTEGGHRPHTSSPEKSPAGEEPSHKWVEVGLGPLKVLQHPSTGRLRLVQRREATPGGQGTKLIVNLRLDRELSPDQPSEKHVRVSGLAFPTLEEAPGGAPAGPVVMTVLLKFKLAQEASDCVACLQLAATHLGEELTPKEAPEKNA